MNGVLKKFREKPEWDGCDELTRKVQTKSIQIVPVLENDIQEYKTVAGPDKYTRLHQGHIKVTSRSHQGHIRVTSRSWEFV